MFEMSIVVLTYFPSKCFCQKHLRKKSSYLIKKVFLILDCLMQIVQHWLQFQV